MATNCCLFHPFLHNTSVPQIQREYRDSVQKSQVPPSRAAFLPSASVLSAFHSRLLTSDIFLKRRILSFLTKCLKTLCHRLQMQSPVPLAVSYRNPFLLIRFSQSDRRSFWILKNRFPLLPTIFHHDR